MNILITGANGQLGMCFKKCIRYYQGPNFYYFVTRSLYDITSDYSIQKEYLIDNGIDVIINCAAYTNVDLAETNRDEAYNANSKALDILSDVCQELDIKLIHISTDYVFDGTKNTPLTEDMESVPLGVYGKSKKSGEEYIQNSGCNYLIIRTSWLYSEFGKNFFSTMKKYLSEKDEVKVVIDQVGSPTYGYDLAQFIFAIVENGEAMKHNGIYHFSNEGICSWYDFTKAIKGLLNSKCKVTPCSSDEYPSPVKRPHYSVLDKTKVKTDFKYEVPYWYDSLKTCVITDVFQ